MRTRKLVPLPTVLVTSIAPPLLRMIVNAVESPSPVPVPVPPLPEEGERLFVPPRSGFLPGTPEGRCAGKKVTFEREPAEGEYDFKAVGVALLEESQGGRARLRRPNGNAR